jgi:hypothetical protein
VYLNVAGTPTLIINSQAAVVELLDRRAANTSARPRFIMSHELLTGGLFLPLESHTDL